MDERKVNLIAAYENLAARRVIVKQSLLTLSDNDIWLPADDDSDLTPSLHDAIDAMTRLCRLPDKDDHDLVTSGYLHVTDQMIEEINALNACRDAFKTAVAEYKGRDKNNRLLEGNRRRLCKVLEQALKFEGSGRSALAGTSLAELDLKACYRKTRTLAPSMTAINFTKEKRHLRTHRISRTMLEALVITLKDEGNEGPYLEFIKSADNNFAIAKPTTLRTMANIQFSDDRINTLTTPVSSVMVGTDPIPPIKWCQNEKKIRKVRGGKQVDTLAPFIPILSCYKYHHIETRHDVR